MSRYINEEEILDSVLKYYTEAERSGKFNFYANEIKQNFADMVKEIPTADVKPIVYGKWIYLYDFDGLEICECNKCGVSQEFDGGIFDVNSRRTNFCRIAEQIC